MNSPRVTSLAGYDITEVIQSPVTVPGWAQNITPRVEVSSIMTYCAPLNTLLIDHSKHPRITNDPVLYPTPVKVDDDLYSGYLLPDKRFVVSSLITDTSYNGASPQPLSYVSTLALTLRYSAQPNFATEWAHEQPTLRTGWHGPLFFFQCGGFIFTLKSTNMPEIWESMQLVEKEILDNPTPIQELHLAIEGDNKDPIYTPRAKFHSPPEVWTTISSARNLDEFRVQLKRALTNPI